MVWRSQYSINGPFGPKMGLNLRITGPVIKQNIKLIFCGELMKTQGLLNSPEQWLGTTHIEFDALPFPLLRQVRA